MKHPLVLAPMGGCAGGALASSVALAGGLGLVGSGGESVDHLVREWEKGAQALNDWTTTTTSERSGTAAGAGAPGRSLPLGFGVNVAQMEASDLAAHVKRLRPSHVYLSFPPQDVGASGHADAVVSNGAIAMSNAGSVAQAVALAAAGVDCVVIQGSDAGGHTHPGASAFAILPEARDALDAAGHADVLLAYAGGVCDGRGVAAALALGADAVVLGTRLAAAAESDYTPKQRAALGHTADGAVSTTLGTFVDWVNGNFPHSSGLPGRCLVTRTTMLEEDWKALGGEGVEGGEDLIKDMAARGVERAGGDGVEWGTTWAGAAVGLVPSGPEPQSARDIVEEVVRETVNALSRTARLVRVEGSAS